MTDTLERVEVSGEAACPESSAQVVLRSQFGFDETLDRLKAGIAAEDLWVIAEINPQMLLRKGGYAIPATRQILFFHPRYMARLLSTNAAAIVEAPLKFVVMESDRDGVVVRFPDPGSSLARYEGLAGLGEELSQVALRIVEGVRLSSPVAA